EANSHVVATVTPVASSAGYRVADAPADSARIRVRDNDGRPIVSLSADSLSVNEDMNLEFVVELSAPSTRNARVNYATSDGSALAVNSPQTTGVAVAGEDYTGASGTLNFIAGETTATITVAVTDDNISERPVDETLTLTLSRPALTQLSTSSITVAVGTIVDDEGDAVLSVGAATAPESTNMVFPVTLAPASGQTVVVSYATADGGGPDSTNGVAEAGKDYNAISGTMLTFMPGVAGGQVTVTVLDDDITEGNEDLTLTLSGATNATLAADGASAVGTITDDEMPTLSISASASPVFEGADAVFVITSTNSPMSDTVVGVVGVEVGDFVSDALPTRVTLAANETIVALTVATTDDIVDEADGSLTMQIDFTNTPPIYTMGSATIATVTLLDNDVPAVSVADTSAAESTNLIFTVTISPVSYQTVLVKHDTANGSAEAGKDYIAITNAMLTFAPGDSVGHITVTIINDDITESRENLTLTLSSTTNSTFTDPEATGTIIDDEMPTLSINASASSITEGDNAVFIITSTNSPMDDTVVGVAGIETGNFVTNALPTTATLAANKATTTLTIATTDDMINETDGSLTMQLNIGSTLPNYQEGSASTATVNIADNDVPAISIADASTAESANLIFTVTISPVSYQTVVVSYATADGTAEEGKDYTGITNAMLTFASGTSSGHITVSVLNDDITEGSEDLTLTLSDATNATLSASASSATGTITDDEMPTLSIRASASSITEGDNAVFIITSTNSPMSDTTISVMGTPTGNFIASTLPTTVTLVADETTATLTVATTDDMVDEANGSLTMQLNIGGTLPNYQEGSVTIATVVIEDNDVPAVSVADVSAAESVNLVFSVTISPVSYQTVVVNYATMDGTAEAGKDYTAISDAMLTFVQGASSGQITVSVFNDDITEGSEDLTLTLSNATNATLAVGASAATGTITDDEMPTLSISASASSITEGDDAVFIVTSTNSPMDDTVINVMGSEEGDFVANALPTAVTLVANETTATFTVVTTDDSTDEANGSLTMQLNIGSTMPNYQEGSVTIATVVIADNDVPAISVADTSAPESANLVFSVTLAPVSYQTVVVTYATMDGTAEAGKDYIAINNATLTFAPGTSGGQITVTVINDDITEGDEDLTLTLSNATNATLAVGASSAIGTITDDEMPTLSISAMTSPITEGDNAVFIVTSTNSPMDDAVINLMGSEKGDFVANALLTTVTLVANETTATFTVATIDDSTDEANGSLTMQIDSTNLPTNYTTGSVTIATVVIEDNDVPLISVADTSAVESANLVFSVTISPTSYQTVVVTYATMDGMAEAGKDYTAISNAMLTFVPDASSGQITVSVFNDDITEGNEDLTLTLSNATNATLAVGASAATGTITDDEMSMLSIRAVTSPIAEGDDAVFIITSTNSPMDDTVINVMGSEKGDFVANALPTAVTLVANETTVTLTVATTDDSTDEADGSLTMQIDSTNLPTNYTAGSVTIVTVVIEDNDGPGISVADSSSAETDGQMVFTIALSDTPVEQTQVSWTTADDMTPGAMRATTGNDPPATGTDYIMTSGTLTFAAGASTISLNVTVKIVNDDAVEPDETFLLVLSSPTNEATLAGAEATGTITSEDISVISGADTTSAESAYLIFPVTLSPVSYKTVVVSYATMDGTAEEGKDYTGISNAMLTFAPGDSGGYITVTVINDDITEGSEDLTLTLSGPINATLAASASSATGTITDDEMPTLSISAATSPITEGAAAVFIIASTNSPMSDTTIGVMTSEDGNFATNTLPTAVTLVANETTVTLTVATTDDMIDEADGNLTLQIDSTKLPTSYTTSSVTVATVVIEDNDGPDISVADASAAETDGQMAFTISLSATPAEQTEVSWTTNDNTAPNAMQATAGTDYMNAGGTLTFAANGNTTMNVTVSIVNDDAVEPDETFLLTLSNPTNEATLADAEATGTITSEDVPAVHITADQVAVTEGNAALFTIIANQEPLSDLTINIDTTFNPDTFRTGTPPATATIVTGTTTAAYTVNTQSVNDTSIGTITVIVNGGSSTYTATAPTSATVKVLDSSTRTISVSGPATVTEDNATAQFTVMLSSTPESTGHTVTVNYATSNGTAIMSSDYTAASGTLTFAGSETSKTVTVTILNDTVYENPNEQFQMRIFNPQPSPGNEPGTNIAGVNIVDDDRITLSIAPVTGKASVTEAPNATLAYEVSFPSSGATKVQSNLALNYAVDSTSTATSNTDYTAPSGSLTFSSTDGTNQTVLVTVLDDDIVESAETVVLTLGIPIQPRITLVSGSTSATGTITDDEMPTLSISASASSVTEGGNAVFIIASTNSPMSDTTIGVMTSEDGDFATNTLPTAVTLAANETTATLTVATTDDMVDEADGSLTMQLNIGSTLPNYQEGSASATVNIADNDVPAISVADVTAAESANLVFPVTISPVPYRTVVVSYATADDSAEAGKDYIAVSNATLTFAPGASGGHITVTVLNDDITEGSEDLTLTLSGETDATLANPEATGTITDDEMPTLSISAVTSPITEGDDVVFIIASTNSPMS
ncbi:MAG: Calx-beta domain-containing protein, partial [Pseudohongiellaceae bacterium]